MASAAAGVLPTAVRPTRPCSVTQLIMWKTTPGWRAWSKCSPCRATMSNRSSIVSARRLPDSRWSVATRCFSTPSRVRNRPVLPSYRPPVRNCSVRNGCVVPPLRRLSSIAYDVHVPAESRAEHLVVGGQQLDLPARRDAKLNAGTSQLDPGHELLDDAAALGQLVHVRV